MDLLNLYVRVGAKDEASPAIDDISSNIIGKLGSAAKTAAQALAGTFAVKKVVDFGKAAFDAYSEFEQLEGGVAKLYGNAGQSIEEYAQSVGRSVDEVQDEYARNERAQELMMQNAQQAWRTAGMDANSYMQTATSFSAALINSLGGDTEEAAKLTDRAMTAISDNYNTFGSDMESVKNAFMGFSKQNYTMLDNLKLGYGGTKEEMERLIKDANEWGAANGEAADLSMDSFADVVTAIERIQKKQGIYGTTQREALGTIEGSINATKAAWSNLVAEFGKPDADLGARVADMMAAIFGEGGKGGVLRNVTKEVGVIAKNIITALSNGIGEGVDWLLTNGADKLRDGIKDMIAKIGDVSEFIRGMRSIDIGAALFGSGDSDSGILSRVGKMLSDMTENISEWMPDIQKAFGELWGSVSQVIAEKGPEILASIGTVLGGIGEWLITWWPEIHGWLVDTWMGLMEWLYSNGPEILQTIGEILDSIVSWLWENAPLILQAVGETMMNVVMAIGEHAPEILASIAEMVGTVIGYLIEHAGEFLIAAGEWITQMVQGIEENGIQIPTWFQELPQKILDALGDLGGLLLDAGAQIIDGLVKGITDNVGKAGQALLDGIGGAVDGALSFLGINSPSKLFDWVGQMSMEGLAGGIEDAAAKAEAATASAVQGVYGAASGTIDVSMAPSGNNAILAALGEIRDNMNMSVTLDSGALVGGIAPQMNTALGGIY